MATYECPNINNNMEKAKPVWKNKQKTLMLGSKGMASVHKQLINDLFAMIPQAKKESKVEKDHPLAYVKELTLLHSCNNTMYFESRKTELYLWIGKYPNGPSAKFLIQNIMCLEDTRFPGNCLKYSRPMLSFDKSFKEPHLKLIQGMIIDAIGTPKYHPKSKPFLDHVMCFYFDQGKIYARHYQINNNTEAKNVNIKVDAKKLSLAEIGPRFTMQVVKIFDDFLGGESIWMNKHFTTPAQIRRDIKKVYQTKPEGNGEGEEIKAVKGDLDQEALNEEIDNIMNQEA